MVNSENPINTDTDEPIEHDTLNHPTQAEELIALDKRVSSNQEERNEIEIDPSLSGDDREVLIAVLDEEILVDKMVFEGLKISILELHSRGKLSEEDSEKLENLLAQEREEAQQIVETSERERTQIVEITDERLQLDDTARGLFRPDAKI
jgi:DNA-binding protein YbaB